jgi:hypothetical protein
MSAPSARNEYDATPFGADTHLFEYEEYDTQLATTTTPAVQLNDVLMPGESAATAGNTVVERCVVGVHAFFARTIGGGAAHASLMQFAPTVDMLDAYERAVLAPFQPALHASTFLVYDQRHFAAAAPAAARRNGQSIDGIGGVWRVRATTRELAAQLSPLFEYRVVMRKLVAANRNADAELISLRCLGPRTPPSEAVLWTCALFNHATTPLPPPPGVYDAAPRYPLELSSLERLALRRQIAAALGTSDTAATAAAADASGGATSETPPLVRARETLLASSAQEQKALLLAREAMRACPLAKRFLFHAEIARIARVYVGGAGSVADTNAVELDIARLAWPMITLLERWLQESPQRLCFVTAQGMRFMVDGPAPAATLGGAACAQAVAVGAPAAATVVDAVDTVGTEAGGVSAAGGGADSKRFPMRRGRPLRELPYEGFLAALAAMPSAEQRAAIDTTEWRIAVQLYAALKAKAARDAEYASFTECVNSVGEYNDALSRYGQPYAEKAAARAVAMLVQRIDAGLHAPVVDVAYEMALAAAKASAQPPPEPTPLHIVTLLAMPLAVHSTWRTYRHIVDSLDYIEARRRAAVAVATAKNVDAPEVCALIGAPPEPPTDEDRELVADEDGTGNTDDNATEARVKRRKLAEEKAGTASLYRMRVQRARDTIEEYARRTVEYEDAQRRARVLVDGDDEAVRAQIAAVLAPTTEVKPPCDEQLRAMRAAVRTPALVLAGMAGSGKTQTLEYLRALCMPRPPEPGSADALVESLHADDVDDEDVHAYRARVLEARLRVAQLEGTTGELDAAKLPPLPAPRVVACAYTNGVTNALRRRLRGGCLAMTTHRLLYTAALNPGLLRRVEWLIVDETSMQYAALFGRVLHMCTTWSSALRGVILCGDTAQLPSIKPGQMFTALCRHLERRYGAEAAVHRFVHNHRAEACRPLGDACAAMRTFGQWSARDGPPAADLPWNQTSVVHVAPPESAADGTANNDRALASALVHEVLARRLQVKTAADMRDVMVISMRNRTVYEVNRQVDYALFGGLPHGALHVGARVVFKENAPSLDLWNNELYHLVRIEDRRAAGGLQAALERGGAQVTPERIVEHLMQRDPADRRRALHMLRTASYWSTDASSQYNTDTSAVPGQYALRVLVLEPLAERGTLRYLPVASGTGTGAAKLAWAMTCYSLQGAQCPTAVYVLPTGANNSTGYETRAVAYTAFSRAQQRAVAVCRLETLHRVLQKPLPPYRALLDFH